MSTKFRRSCRRIFQIHRPIGDTLSPLHRGSLTSYLYLSIYKDCRRQSSVRDTQLHHRRCKNHHCSSRHMNKNVSLTHRFIDPNQTNLLSNNNINNNGKEQSSMDDSQSRDLVTIKSNEEIPIPTSNNTIDSQRPFQVLNEEDENIVY